MEIIEIGKNSFCLRAPFSSLPDDRESLRAFASEALGNAGFSLPSGAEITVFSNGVFSLVFVCGSTFSGRFPTNSSLSLSRRFFSF